MSELSSNLGENIGRQKPLFSREMALNNYATGLLIFLSFFIFSLIFSLFFRSFYSDDNVVAEGPIFVEAARRFVSGEIPFQSVYVGGGGGVPIIFHMSRGVLSPFTIIPAIVLNDTPELMVNVIVSLHLAIFAVGGWFLACCLKTPRWRGLVVASSLGFSGFNWIWGSSWLAITIPYAFLPWLLGGIIRSSEAESFRQKLGYQALSAFAMYSLFYSGCPNAPFYSFFVLLFCLGGWVLKKPERFKKLLLNLLPQAVFFLLVISPYLWKAWEIYNFFERAGFASDWRDFSVPLVSYVGLFVPNTYSLWVLWSTFRLISNGVIHMGLVPSWFVLIAFCRNPSLLLRAHILVQVVGLLFFVIVMSPSDLYLDNFFSSTPVLNTFRYPFRALPAFQVLLVYLFMDTATEFLLARKRLWGEVMVIITVVSGLHMIGFELRKENQLDVIRGWFGQTATFRDQESWKSATLDYLRRCGFVAVLADTRRGYFNKPRLFFHGNLGAQFGIKTVGSYMMGYPCGACEKAGMDHRGCFVKWPPAKNFILTSAKKPRAGSIGWDNGIGPQSIAELSEKTYVGAVIIDTNWTEPISFFKESQEWRLLDQNEWASIFVRRGAEQ